MSTASNSHRSRSQGRGRRSRQCGAVGRGTWEVLEDRRLLSFGPATSFPVAANPYAVVTANFNNDGRLDLATADFGDNVVGVLLEDRTVPSTFTVLNLADSGEGSLRQAVLDANAHPGAPAPASS